MKPSQEKRAARIFDMLLKEYERILKDGDVIGVDKEGNPIIGRPSAAKLARIQRFLEDHRIGRATGEANPVAKILASRRALRLSGTGKMPPLSDKPDAATA